MVDVEEKIREIMEIELLADKWKQGVSWKGYDVYVPVRKKYVCIGYPFVVLVKGDEVRPSTPEESLEYINFKQKAIKK